MGSGGTGLGGAGKREIGSGGVDAGDLGAGGAGGGNLGTGGGASMGGAGGGSGDETGTRSPADANFLGTGGTDTPDARPNVDTPDTRPDNNSNKDTATDNGPKDTVSSSSADGGIVVPDGYRLVWSDEFNGNGKPDPATWNYEKGFVRNNELQWYQADNASVQNGLLVIEGRKEQVTNPNYVAGSTLWTTSRQYGQYTASSMTTSALPGWQYGRFEMRARIPTSAGMWPAWWALGKSGEWPASGEIDMMEYYNGKVLANVACGTATRWVAKWDSATKALSTLGASWSANFHIWRMDWDTQNINLYLDDALMNGVPLASMLNADGSSPFKQPVYMIVNLAIGGDNGGDPSATIFPVRYEIDYIRVFQKL